MAQRILIIEDEQPIAELLEYALKQEGYETGIALTGGDGIRLAETERPDMVLIDWMLPDCSGIDLCRMFTRKYRMPILMLTARSRTDDKVQGLEAGADDYITKPFEMREVLMRIKAVLRRVERCSGQEKPLSLPGGLCIRPQEMSVTLNGRPVELTPREFELLLYLLHRPGRVLTRAMLLEELWGYEYAGDSRTVDTHIQRLRKKLGSTVNIETVFGVGYKYVP
ncbi:MAG: response regulator transcription factor [Clostridiales bacterium]|nr:response regulator transcription factor [Clostridiales bacterium]